jgi:hypothetical protein
VAVAYAPLLTLRLARTGVAIGQVIEKQLETTEQNVRLCLELNAESVSGAVIMYIRREVDLRRLAQLQKYDPKTESAVRDHLLSNANNTFLWVALVC